MSQFIFGALVMGSAIAGLFFLRFWRLSADRFFLLFAMAFWILGANWLVLAVVVTAPETRGYLYLVRLAAFVLIIAAIVDKNRRRPG